MPDWKLGLHPHLIDAVDSMLTELHANKLNVTVFSGKRDPKEQDKLYALGRTVVNPDGKSPDKPMGNIITKASGWRSWHCMGLAVDLAFLNSKNKPFWPSDDDPRWQQIGKIGKTFGLEWGGDWKFKDLPHFQMKGKFQSVDEAVALVEKSGLQAVWDRIEKKPA